MCPPLQKKKGKAAEPEPEPEPEPAPEEPPPEAEPAMENVDLGGGGNDAAAEANPDDMWGFATTGKKKKGKKGKVSLTLSFSSFALFILDSVSRYTEPKHDKAH